MLVKFTIKKWQGLCLFAFCLVVISYLMAATFPECGSCARGEANAIQVWHGIMMFLSLFAMVPVAILAIIDFSDGE